MIDFGLGLTLSRIERHELDSLRQFRNTPAISKWCRQRDLISSADQERWFQMQNDDPTIQMYSIHTINGNYRPLIGACGLTSLDLVNRHAEFSLYIAPGFQRQGHGKKALKLLISHGFHTYGLEHIWGESFQENPAAKVFIDLGLRREGIRRHFYFKNGRFIDAHLFSILREDWLNSDQFPKEPKCQS